MSGVCLTVIAVVVGLSACTLLKTRIESQAAEKMAEQNATKAILLSQEETKRMKIFTELIAHDNEFLGL